MLQVFGVHTQTPPLSSEVPANSPPLEKCGALQLLQSRQGAQWGLGDRGVQAAGPVRPGRPQPRPCRPGFLAARGLLPPAPRRADPGGRPGGGGRQRGLLGAASPRVPPGVPAKRVARSSQPGRRLGVRRQRQQKGGPRYSGRLLGGRSPSPLCPVQPRRAALPARPPPPHPGRERPRVRGGAGGAWSSWEGPPGTAHAGGEPLGAPNPVPGPGLTLGPFLPSDK